VGANDRFPIVDDLLSTLSAAGPVTVTLPNAAPVRSRNPPATRAAPAVPPRMNAPALMVIGPVNIDAPTDNPPAFTTIAPSPLMD